MKKITLLLVLLSLAGCRSRGTFNITGSWISKHSETRLMHIDNTDEGLYVEVFDRKTRLEELQGNRYAFELLDKDFELLPVSDKEVELNGTPFIRLEDSETAKISGLYMQEKEETTFKSIQIRLENGGHIWSITQNDDRVADFFPVSEGNHFIFSYDGQTHRFKLQNNCLIRSDGEKYCK
ncbi:hypothetical protein [Robertkochia aurantiaca]|uniref:hypothetical protein n=1 Tax=Robertkochia aurantiaca TaxID=2873700 RepID=UPI001CC90665|nr:hypothetical protein [Robertkochia sp. 3YJGBD-33]